ncbi:MULTISPECIES: hypothetical protein [Trichocoleus]|uniref:Multidrug transporter n=1 Tax=Trichocoleus desertorum GB2-A4 TaxID=2933944 RepID=A0ABV0JAF9_9CYAN|nr:hypothetical protein [Trichocoleus sp. FACHB-46]MBD1861037.1 hypothetical protein [Trichocoleus sp. FACHB-46]
MFIISPKRVALLLTGVIGVLLLASLAGSFSTHVLGHGNLFGIVRLFNVDKEGNIPTWYASISLLACSVLLAIIAQAQPKETTPNSKDWRALSAVFLFLSIDEAARLHELLILPLRTSLGTRGILYFAWVIPYGLLVAFLGLRFLKFLTQLPTKTRRSFFLAAFLYLSGALGMEMIAGQYTTFHGQDNFTYALLTTIEEALEMSGVLVFIYALLVYLRRYIQAIEINIRNTPLEPVIDTSPQEPHSI